MRRSVLVAHATRGGSARRVGELVADTLAAHGLAVDVLPAATVDAPDRYGAVVVGGPVRLGRWHRDARQFLRRHHAALGRVPVAVFATERDAIDRSDGEIERALATAPEVEPVTSAHFAVVPAHRPGRDSRSRYDAAAVRRWAEQLARELGA